MLSFGFETYIKANSPLVNRLISDTLVNAIPRFSLPIWFSFLPTRRYASAGYSDRNVSVRLSVRHAPVLCQNEES